MIKKERVAIKVKQGGEDQCRRNGVETAASRLAAGGIDPGMEVSSGLSLLCLF
jgi:hypothetical protein